MRGVGEGIELLVRLIDGWRALEQSLSFWNPALAMPAWLAPAVALGGVVSLVVLSGISLASLATLVTAMLFAVLLLENVFGVTLQIAAA